MKYIACCLLALVAVLAVAGCDDGSNSSGPGGAVDQRLVGYWYKVTAYTPSIYHPPQRIWGFHLTPEPIFRKLAVRTATGELDYEPDSSKVTVHFARNGKIAASYFSVPGGIDEDTCNYTVKGDTLIISEKGMLSGIWRRGLLGQIVTQPVQSILSATVDGTRHSIQPVASHPGGFVVMNPSFTLKGYFSDPYVWMGGITITVDAFTGPGVYAIEPGKGLYESIEGDIAWGFFTDTLNTGTITVDVFDEAAGRCSGSFEFVARNKHGLGYPSPMRHISNGQFSVPVYR